MGDRLAVRPFRISHKTGLSDFVFVLGATAGIRNVVRAAGEINAEIARKRSSGDEETGS